MNTYSARLRLRVADIITVMVTTLVCLVAWPNPARAEVSAGKIVRSLGDTWLIRAGTVATPVTEQYALRSGDRLSTGSSGRVDIRYEDGTVMAMGPSSSLTIERFTVDGARSQSWFALARGTLRTITGMIGKLNPTGFKLSTPTAVMGIRGTDFSVWQQDCRRVPCDGRTEPPLEVEVHSGKITVATANGEVLVPAGRRAVVAGDSARPSLTSLNSGRTQQRSALSRPRKSTPTPPRNDEAKPGMHMLR